MKSFRIFLLAMAVLNEITTAFIDGVVTVPEIMRILKRVASGFNLEVDTDRINVYTGDLNQEYNFDGGCLIHVPQDILDQLKIDLTDQLGM